MKDNHEDIVMLNNEVEDRYAELFINETGIAPYVECPLCGGRTIPRKSRKGYFIGCSNFPKCEFLASKLRKYSSKEQYSKRLEKESEVIEQAKAILAEEGESLYGWMQGNVKIVKNEKIFIGLYKGYSGKLTYMDARRTLSINKKAKTLGYPEKKLELYKDKLTSIAEYIENQIDLYHNKLKICNPEISRDEAKQEYANLYKNSYGISFDDLCPKCNSPLSLRKHTQYWNSSLNHYIRCSNDSECGFYANSNHKFLPEDEREKEQEIINKALCVSADVWIDLCGWLESQRTVESKKKFPNWYVALNSVQYITSKINMGLSITGRNANRLIDILEKATSFGFKEKDSLKTSWK